MAGRDTFTGTRAYGPPFSSMSDLDLDILHWTQDRNRIDRLNIPHGSIPQDSTEILLWVSNEYFTAGAVWKRINGVWSCIKAAPIIRWMVGMNKDRAKLELIKKGCVYQWISTTQHSSLKDRHN